MVNFGSPFTGGAFTRVSSVMARNVILANLTRNQNELLKIQEQLSTGLRINRPSDDPIGARRIQDFTMGLQRDAQFLRNIETASSRLNQSEVALSSAGELMNRAREIMLEQSQGFATASSRAQAAEEISLLIRTALSQANAQFEGRSLFAGSRTEDPAFALVGGEIVFLGNLEDLGTGVADGLEVSSNATGDAFGAVSAELVGRDPVTLLPIDLDPAVSALTDLSDLHAGRGVVTGSIEVTGPLGTAVIDLRAARTIGDVISLINAAGTGVTATINPAQNGLELSAAGAITVADLPNGQSARDLGILGAVAISPLTGGDLNPRLTKKTRIQDLRGGAGLDSDGLVLTNQTSTQTFTATIGPANFDPGDTIEELLNAINSSDALVAARISEEGTRIDLFSRLSGGRLKVAENGGTTAQELGLLSTLARSRLVDLNGGLGVGSADGPDIRITKTDGTSVLIDVDSLDTVQDVLDRINAEPDLAASINGLDQIVIVDSAGGAGNLVVSDVSPSAAATQLGISGSAATTITGTTVPFAGEQTEGIFTALIRLRDGLLADDSGQISAAGRVLDAGQERIHAARGRIGTRVSALEITRDRLELETLELEKLRSSTRDVDLAEAATRFHIQQTVLEAALATAARILDTHLFRFLQ